MKFSHCAKLPFFSSQVFYIESLMITWIWKICGISGKLFSNWIIIFQKWIQTSHLRKLHSGKSWRLDSIWTSVWLVNVTQIGSSVQDSLSCVTISDLKSNKCFNFHKNQNSEPLNVLKMADFALRESSKLISRKIWTWKIMKFPYCATFDDFLLVFFRRNCYFTSWTLRTIQPRNWAPT